MILMDIEIEKLVLHVVIVSLAAVGVTEWLKNKIKLKNKKNWAVVGIIVLAVNVTAQMPFVPPVVTTWYNIFTLGVAFMQFAVGALVKIPEAMIKKSFGVSNDNAQTVGK